MAVCWVETTRISILLAFLLETGNLFLTTLFLDRHCAPPTHQSDGVLIDGGS